MTVGEFPRDAWVQAGQGGFGDIAEGVGSRRRLGQSAEPMDADLKPPIMRPAAADVEDFLGASGGVEQIVEFDLQRRRVGEGGEEIRRQNAVQDRRSVAQMPGQSRRRAHNLSDQLKQIRMSLKQREQLNPGGQAVQKGVETQKRRIRIGGRGQRLKQARHQFGENLSGSSRAGRPVAPVVPGADRRVDHLGAAETHLGQGFERVRVRIAAGKRQIAGRLAVQTQRRRAGEQLAIMILNSVQMAH